MSKRRTANGAISAALRKAIAESGVPLLTLQERTGVQRMSILRFVRGDQSLRLDKADLLAAYLGIEVVQKKGK